MKIVLIGAGNVGWHLGHRLRSCGQEVVQVFSRNLMKAKELGEGIQAAFTDNLDEITTTGDLYILAVHDDAIEPVAEKLAASGLQEKLIVHTSGATPMSVFAAHFRRFGVFYPLQTFTKSRAANFEIIPICIDASLDSDRETLTQLARKISGKVFQITDQQRAVLHVAAVFVNNFTNHLFHIGQSVLEREKISFELLLPLIRETVDKLEDGTPGEMQTGPARRGDEETIQRHLRFLEKYPEYQGLYRTLTESILQHYTNKS